jgi:tripartite-type tricarboxylate transporter receptor subunit TctC
MRFFISHMLAAFASALAMAPDVSFGQAYPSRPIKIVVPFPPGGGADVMARLVGEKLASRLGQPVIVENQPGVNTIFATTNVLRSQPDGHTLLLAIDTTMVINPHMYRRLPYKPESDLAPVTMLSTIPFVLVTNKSVPGTLAEFIAYAKTRPGELHFGSGVLTGQLAGELFNRLAGTKLVYVPYRGGSTTVLAVLGGEIPVAIDGISTSLPHWKSGKLNILAVTATKRSALAPEIPTFGELGFPDLKVSLWQSIVAPAGTPREIIRRLDKELTEIMALEEIRQRVEPAGIEPLQGTTDGFARQMREESERWGKLIRELNLPPLD